MNTLGTSKRLRLIRRTLRKQLHGAPPVLRTLRLQREAVWVVSELPTCSAAERRRRHAHAAHLPAGWGDLTGHTASPAQPGAVTLLRRVDPPRASRRRRLSWRDAERQLGTRFPTDYRQLIDDRGPGIVADVLVYGPGTAEDGLDLFSWHTGIRHLLQSLRSITCDHFPPPFYPERGGILPWGLLNGGQIVAWATTSDDPDAWPVVVLSPELDHLTLHPATATGYLLARLPGPDLQTMPSG